MHLAGRSIREAREQEPSAAGFWPFSRFGGWISRRLNFWRVRSSRFLVIREMTFASNFRDKRLLDLKLRQIAISLSPLFSLVLFLARVLAPVLWINQSCVYAHIWARNFSNTKDSCYRSSHSHDLPFDNVNTTCTVFSIALVSSTISY